MDTRITNKYPVSQSEFMDIVDKTVSPLEEQFMNSIDTLKSEIQKLCDERRSIRMIGPNVYLDTKLKIILPDLESFEGSVVTDLSDKKLEHYSDGCSIDDKLQYDLPKLTELREKQSLLNKIYVEGSWIVCKCDDKKYTTYLELEVAYNPHTNAITMEKGVSATIIPIIRLDYSYVSDLLVDFLIPYEMCPEHLSVDSANCWSDLVEIYKRYPHSLMASENKVVFCVTESWTKEYSKESGRSWIDRLHCKLAKVLKQVYESRNVEGGEMDTREELLNCEKIRADIDPYEENILTDINRGHWDLWLDQDERQYTVEVANKMVARNPACDINENGVIAIDFGTKSTIVVYQSDIEHSLPMGVGDGNLSKEPSPKRYENPTVMHFVALERFLNDYASKKGRPKTRWEDLTISHTAMEQFSNSKSEEYYEYLHQIKQWAGHREKKFRVQSHDGKTYVLPAFCDLKENDWNPIEIYAYYIGLYINNMRKGHGIFLDYYLSFPVTYESKIREKIVQSFEKGLKKSLPSSILENKEVMKRFHVNGEISEPTAYAVCALQEYGFEPEEDEEVFYGIFDFGGGTTDFDFGLWKESSKKRYDYTIENFGASGDEYLGGENLLEMLAFEVFKENQSVMRNKGYTFTLAPECTEFWGSDSLLADSQEAEKNMHNLMEQIRPYWETSDDSSGDNEDEHGEVDKVIDKIYKMSASREDESQIVSKLEEITMKRKAGKYDESDELKYLRDLINEYQLEDKEDDRIEFVTTLFDKEGHDHPNEKLIFSKAKLNHIIEERIRKGVNNFFSALMLSYQNDKVKKPTIVNILLAGNSCKSPVVKRIFEEEIAKQERLIKETYNKQNDVGKLFEIFPPLGTEEAYKKMESREIIPDRNNFEKPTGKTGVAFGLIQCRAGGSIERVADIGIKEEIPFQYYIGWRAKKKFVIFKDDSKITKEMGKPDYNVWYKFIEADDTIFDLYYTTLPECVSGKLLVDGNAAVKRLRCEIDVVDESASVYIRAVDPHTLEYVVARGNDVEATKLGNIVRKELSMYGN